MAAIRRQGSTRLFPTPPVVSARFFRNKTRSVERQARQYLSGLMQAERKNMQHMEEIVPESNEQSLQHFLSNSPWDVRGVMDQVALDVDAEIGGHEDTMMIDESGLPKKGHPDPQSSILNLVHPQSR